MAQPIGKIVTEILRQGFVEPLQILFPVPKRKKEAFLELARENVNFYQPKIEEKFGVSLGKINVKDYRDFRGDRMEDVIKERFVEYSIRTGQYPSGFTANIIASPVVIATSLLDPLNLFIGNLSGNQAKYYNSSIYFMFGYMNRFLGNFEIDGKRTNNLDQTIVHELSHKLWYSLGGDKSRNDNFTSWRTWNEGFATYCADEYLFNLYSPCTEIYLDNNPRLYERGKIKIQKLISEKGEQILKEVPRRWKEFEEGKI